MSKELTISNLDQHLKPLQIDSVTTPIELSTEAIRMNKDITLMKDLIIEGDLSVLGTQSHIEMTNGVSINTTTNAGALSILADTLSLLASSYSGDGDASDNTSALALVASDGYDSKVLLMEAASTRWAIGNDADDSDKLKLDAGTAVVGGATKLTLDSSGNLTVTGDVTSGDDVIVPSTGKISLDNGGDTYITEASADSVRVIVGGDILMQLAETSSAGNVVEFRDACVGFTQQEPTYDATNTVVDFRISNKQHLTFGSGNITNLKLYFRTSGNFQLLIKQDGTGSRTITNYNVLDAAGNVAGGSSTVKFAGGSNPTLTTDANHVDIISFYWDNDNEIAYGVPTLDFQF